MFCATRAGSGQIARLRPRRTTRTFSRLRGTATPFVLTGLALALSAASAGAQGADPVDLRDFPGLVEVVIRADGSVLLVFVAGHHIVVCAGDATVAEGTGIFVSAETAAEILRVLDGPASDEPVVVGDCAPVLPLFLPGGGGGAPIGLAAGGAVLAAAGGGGAGGGGDDAPAVITIGPLAASDDTVELRSGQLATNRPDVVFVPQVETPGTFGSFTLAPDGVWSYRLDTASPDLRALPPGRQVTEVFPVATADGGTAVVPVVILGTNDAPVIAATPAGTFTETDVNTAQDLDDGGEVTFGDIDADDVVAIEHAADGDPLRTGGAALDGGLSAALVGGFDILAPAPQQMLMAFAAPLSAPQTTAAGFDLDTIDWVFEARGVNLKFLAEGEAITWSYTVTARDSHGETASDRVFFRIEGRNDAPVVDAGLGTVEEDVTLTAGGRLTVADPDEGQSWFRPLTGVRGLHGDLTFDAGGDWTYTLDNTAAQALRGGETVQDRFPVLTADGTETDVTITVLGRNDMPTVSAGSGEVTEDLTLIAGGMLTVVDPDAGESVFQPLTGEAGSYGTLTLDAGGTWAYTLDNAAPQVQALGDGDAVPDVFMVLTADGTETTVTITVQGRYKPGEIHGDLAGAATEDTVPTDSGTLAIKDPGGATFVAETIIGSHGSLTIGADGGWTYTLDNDADAVQALPGGATVTDSVTVRTTGGATAAVTIIVTGTNDPAVIGTVPTPCETYAFAGEAGTLAGITVAAFGSDHYLVGTALDDDGPGSAYLIRRDNLDTADANGDRVITAAEVRAAGGYRINGEDGGFFGATTDTLTTVAGASAGGDLLIAQPNIGTVYLFRDGDLATLDGNGDGTVEGGDIVDGPAGYLLWMDVSGAGAGQTFGAAMVAVGDTGTALDGDFLISNSDEGSGGEVYLIRDEDLATMDAADWWGDPGDRVIDLREGAVPAYRFLGAAGEAAGSALDVDGALILIGAARMTQGGATVGGAYLVDAAALEALDTANDGANDNRIRLADVAGPGGYRLHGPAGAGAGGTVAFAGDVLGSGQADIVLAFPGGAGGGLVHLVQAGALAALDTADGSDGSIDLGNVTAHGGYVFDAGAAGAAGLSVTGLGDLDGDGRAELAIGVPGANGGAGAVYLILSSGFEALDGAGADDNRIALSDVGVTHGFRIDGIAAGDGAGTSLAGGDGAGLLIGAPGSGGGAGAAHLLDLAPVLAAVQAGTTAGIVSLAQPCATGAGGNTDAGEVREDVTTTAAGVLPVTDRDTGEAGFRPGTIPGSYGSLIIDAGGAWTYTLDNDRPEVQALDSGQTLTDTVTVTAIDGTTGTVTITINGTTEPATITGTLSGAVTEDDEPAPQVTGTLDTTPDDTVAFEAQAVTTDYGTFTLGTDGAWTYALNNAAAAVQALRNRGTGPDAVIDVVAESFAVQTAEGATATVTITITGAADAAQVAPGAGGVTEDAVTVATGILPVTDPDTGEAAFRPQTETTGYGSFTLLADGGWTYTLDNVAAQAIRGDATVTEQFTATTVDGTATTVTITIDGAAEHGEIVGDDSGAVTEDAVTVATGTLDTHGDGSIAFVGQTETTAYGSFTLLTDGSWTYTLNNAADAVQDLPGGAEVTDSFAVQTAAGASHSVTITITGANDPAVVGSGSGALTEDGAASIGGTLATVTDRDTGEARYRAATDALSNYGTFTIDEGGTWSFTPDYDHPVYDGLAAGAVATIPFAVTSHDGTGTGTVTVEITGTADAVESLWLLNLDVERGSRISGYGWTMGTKTPFVHLGNHPVGTVGDFDNDGFDDYFIASAGASRTTGPTSYVDSGAVFLYTEAGRIEFYGENATGSLFGTGASAAGDVNGDGFADLIVGAPRAGDGPDGDHSAGAAFVFFGRSTGPGRIVTTTGDLPVEQGFIIRGKNWAELGYGVAGGGDFNGDGFDDLIVSSENDFHGDPADTVPTYVIFGGAGLTGTIDLDTPLAPTQGFQIAGVEPEEGLGYSVSFAGDINGDGFDDMVIGVPFEGREAYYYYGSTRYTDYHGAAYVLFGGNGPVGNIDVSAPLTPTQGFKITGTRPALKVAGGFDFNADGFDDFAVSTRVTPPVGVPYNRVSVIFGKPTGWGDINLDALAPADGFWRVGDAFSGVGDVNGDGFDDFAVTSTTASYQGLSNVGSATIIYGNADGVSNPTSAHEGFRVYGLAAGDLLGTQIGPAGDMNGDGFDDILISAPSGGSYGEVYLIYGGNFIGAVVQPDAGLDRFTGSWRNETISMGVGNDTIAGGGGMDRLSGGAGQDTFLIENLPDQVSVTILDFKEAEGDVIDLTDFGFADAGAVQALLIDDGALARHSRFQLDADTLLIIENYRPADFDAQHFILV